MPRTMTRILVLPLAVILMGGTGLAFAQSPDRVDGGRRVGIGAPVP